jgi:transcriptional regulator with XRE-family HTH domain
MNQAGFQNGTAIRQLREERGYRSVKSLAARVGLKPQSLSNIELGNKPASIAVLMRIARELRVPVTRLLKDDEAEAEATAAVAVRAAQAA